MEIKKIRRILHCRCGEVLSDEIEERAVEKKDRFPRLGQSQPFLNSGFYCFTCQKTEFPILDEIDPNPSYFMPLAHIHI